MFGIPDTPRDRPNLEGDKKAIDELIKGLSKEELKEFKQYAMDIMQEQGIYETIYPVMYRNCYKYICARRKFKYEIEAMTEIKIKGDYISTKDYKWKWLSRVVV